MVIDADVAFLADLESTAEQLLERHLSAVKEWHPHTLVPWSRGEDFADDYEWSPSESDMPAEVRSALFVNLLTEDNLPYYFRDIERMFGRDGAWGEWVRRWTAEEGRHAIAIRDYLTVCRTIDPVALERGRMAQMSGGEVPEPPSAADGMCYVTLQELATRISHRNTGKLMESHDRVGYDIMRRVWKVAELEGLTGEAEAARERLVKHIHKTGRVAERLKDRRAAQAAKQAELVEA